MVVTVSRRPYRTDLSDARWALIEPMLSAWRARRAGLGIAKIQHDLREIVNAILYVNRTGIAWEYLPHDFPPFKTVHGYFALWEKEGITEAIHDALRGKVRAAAGRSPEPSAAILDAQTVKTSANVPEHSQGIDAGKKIKGRKRHIATDVLGLLFVVLVTAASVQDTTGGRVVVAQVARQYPTVAVAWVDSGYKQSVIDTGAQHGIDVQVVTKDPQQRGFIPEGVGPCQASYLGKFVSFFGIFRAGELQASARGLGSRLEPSVSGKGLALTPAPCGAGSCVPGVVGCGLACSPVSEVDGQRRRGDPVAVHSFATGGGWHGVVRRSQTGSIKLVDHATGGGSQNPHDFACWAAPGWCSRGSGQGADVPVA